jgi:hypothetical protein
VSPVILSVTCNKVDSIGVRYFFFIRFFVLIVSFKNLSILSVTCNRSIASGVRPSD